MVSPRETVMLAFVLRPRLHDKGLQISIGGLRVGEHSPFRRTVPAANALVPVDVMQKVVRLGGVDDVLDCDQHWPVIRIRFLKHGRPQPMVPRAQVDGSARKTQHGLEQQARRGAYSRNHERSMNARVLGYNSPERAARRDAPLKDEKIESQNSRAHPVGSKFLYDDIEYRHEYRPCRSPEQHEGAQKHRSSQKRHAKQNSGKERGCDSKDDLDGEPCPGPRKQSGPQHSSCSEADRKSTRLNSSHPSISYAVFCLKKKNYRPRD